MLLSSISIVLSASIPFLSIYNVALPHFEKITMTVYVDVVASLDPTILKVPNSDVTIIPYLDAPAVMSVVFVEFSKVISFAIIIRIAKRVWLHRKPILRIFAKVESGDDVGYLLTIFQKVVICP